MIEFNETMANECRKQFPGLSRQQNGRPLVFFDGPAGTQVPQRVIDAFSRYLANSNANHGGEFVTSRETDAVLAASAMGYPAPPLAWVDASRSTRS